MHKSTEALVTRLQEAVSDLSEWPIPEDDSVDTVGLLRAAEVRLAELRRRLVAEMDGTETGEHYRAVETRSAKRSYNTNGLLAAFSGVNLDLLLAHDAVALQWRWTQLQKLADAYDVTLVVAFLGAGFTSYVVRRNAKLKVECQPAVSYTVTSDT